MPECFNSWCVTAKQKVFLKILVYTLLVLCNPNYSACLILFNINPFKSLKESYCF